MTGNDHPRTLSSWSNLNEWTKQRTAARKRNAEIQKGFNHLFGGSPHVQAGTRSPSSDDPPIENQGDSDE